jgi:hypothetical protein
MGVFRRACETPHYGMVPKELGANAAFRADLLRKAGRNPGLQRQLWKMCKEDVLFYINGFSFTSNPKMSEMGHSPRVPFVTWEFQDRAIRELVEAILNGRDVTCPKSREMGASWIILSVFEWFWHFHEEQTFGLVSRTEDYVDKRGDSKSLFWKIDYIHQNQPKWLLPTGREMGDDDPNRKALFLLNADNGSMLLGEATTGDVFRGGRLTGLLLDEFAAVKTDDGFRVAKSTRDVTNCRIFNSTPQGSANAFYEVVHNTSAKQIRMHWTDHPFKAMGLYRTGANGKVELLDGFHGHVEKLRKGEEPIDVLFPDSYPFVLDGKMRSPWYDNQESRCASAQEIAQELDINFSGSDYAFFDADFINILRKKYARPPILVGEINYTVDGLQPRRFREDDKGKLRLWMNLEGADFRVEAGRSFVIGADISAGTGASNSVATIADLKTGHKVGVFKTPRMDPKDFARQVIALCKYFNSAFLIWDGSGPTGKVFTNVVIDSDYRYIYFRRNEKAIGRRISDNPGYFINSESRETLLTEYRADLSESRFINPSDEGLLECLQFIRRPGGAVEHTAAANSQDPSGARSAHGDEVIADALASVAIREKATVRAGSEPEIPVGSLAWRNQMRTKSMKLAPDTLGEGW